MNLEDIGVGRFYRWRNGSVLRVVAVDGDGFTGRVLYANAEKTVPLRVNARELSSGLIGPWVPEVGEKVWHHDPSKDADTPTVVTEISNGVAMVREPGGYGGLPVPRPGYCYVTPRFPPEDLSKREKPQAKRFAVGDIVKVRFVPGVWVVHGVTGGGNFVLMHLLDDERVRISALAERVEAYVPEAPAPTTETKSTETKPTEQAKPVELVVGRWYVVSGTRIPWRVTRVLCGGLVADAESLSGATTTFHRNELTPWVPQVGDWVVRSSRSGEREAPTTVRQVSTAPGSESTVQLADGCAAYLVPGPMLFHVEPCQPPTVTVQVAPPAPETRTVAAEPPCDCPRCTGPVSTLLCMPCMGRDWRSWEPEVVRVSVGVESGYMARGRGVEAIHPLRDEAVRLWREKVKR